MENSNKIIPPHLNAEVYRTDTTGASSISYLDYLRIYPGDSVLIGCSELTGRYWNGGASVYKSITEAQNCSKDSKKSIYLTSGTADGCFVGSSSKVLLCEDNGAVSIWSTANEDVWNLWTLDASASEHDDAALSVDCLQEEKFYVTAGADGNVKVWDLNEMICIRNYLSAHSLAIYGISVQPSSDKCFATGSLDQYVSLWDDNVSKSVLEVVQHDCSVRCLQWINEHKIVFGDEAGILYLVDIRNPQPVTKLSEFPAAVHKIAVDSVSERVAVCCDNKIVSVCDITEEDKSKVIYHDRHMHSSYARGVAWDLKDSNTLHTLGWDGEIKTHKLPGNNVVD